MRAPSLNNPYVLLAGFLSPWKEKGAITALRDQIDQGRMDWGALLMMANLHLCTPIWYVRLQQDGLLDRLPADLAEYLDTMYQLNLERNQAIILELKEFLVRCEQEKIPVLPLKGAATFCDGLYQDNGARMMEDIDLLIKKEDSGKCLDILTACGYEELHNPGIEFDGLPTDSRHQHLQPYHKPGTGIKCELHYRLAYAQAGSALSAESVWASSLQTVLEGIPARIPDPTSRLIHNAVHALVPDCEFIRPAISLRQLTEFSCLAKKYASVLSWRGWQEAGVASGLQIEMSTYLALANRLQGVPWPAGMASSLRSSFHAARISAAGSLYLPESKTRTIPKKLKMVVMKIMLKMYYFLNLPSWVWHNVCYTDQGGLTMPRVWFLIKKMLTARSRAKI